jgi:hypothetical protein
VRSFSWFGFLKGSPSNIAGINRNGERIIVPSSLIPTMQLQEMIGRAGFDPMNVQIASHCLPSGTSPVSDDIVLPASKLSKTAFDLPILDVFCAVKV